MRNNRIKSKFIFVILILLLLAMTIISGRGIISALADTSGYTDVLTDLKTDGEFNINEYPDKVDDYSIQVIQIAESTGRALFVYTYQPCQKTTYLIATQINMSLTDKIGGIVGNGTELTDRDKPQLYDLTLISCNGVFCKYKVNDFTVSSAEIRNYNISSIYRSWIKGIDGETGNDNTINSVYFAVGKIYKAETVDGTVKYSGKNVDVIEIKNPYVDFLSYYNGVTWGSMFGLEGDKYTDVHYIAFSTDKQIDTLKEADVTYTEQTYKQEAFSGNRTYGEKSEPKYKTLTGETDESTANGKYSWKSIQRTADFIATTNLNTATAEIVKKSEFVLVFLTTEYTQTEKYSFMQGHGYEINGTKVSDVSILRLMFETNGKTYNLGAIMNQQEGDDTPGNRPEDTGHKGFWEYIWNCIIKLFTGQATTIETVVAVVALVVAIAVFGCAVGFLKWLYKKLFK